MKYTITYKNGGKPLVTEGKNAKDAFVKEARKSLGVKAMKSKVVKECSSLEDGPFTFEVSNGESSEYFELEDR